jgi:hypothetical protein
MHTRINSTESKKSRHGFSILEVAIAAAVLVIALGSISSSIVSSMRLNRVTRERMVADAAAREMAASMQTAPFGEIFRTFNADPADDPAGAGTAPGADFDVPGLTARPGDADGRVGQLIFPTVVVAAPVAELREDVVLPSLGMPRDLNGDGIDALDHAGDYLVLPVGIRLEWRGAAGDSSLELDVVLTQ